MMREEQERLNDTGKGTRRMGGIRFLTVVYTLVFLLLILIAIGSIFGVFDNPLIDPTV